MQKIPITDKFWCQSKFDKNLGNEMAYQDNRGTSYEFIDPNKGILKFYKNDNLGINISQELLNSLGSVNTNHPTEKIFLNYMSSLVLIKLNDYPNCLFFFNNTDNKIVIELPFIYSHLWIDYKIARSLGYEDEVIQGDILIWFKKYLNLRNITLKATVL